MDAATVFRVISLVPDRTARAQSGSPFDGASSARAEMLSRLLGWLGPLCPISKEQQQLFGLRKADEAIDAAEIADDVEEASIRLPGAGTQIAA